VENSYQPDYATMINLGPYEFTDTDAHRTLTNLGELWAHLIHGCDPVPVAALGEAFEVAHTLEQAIGTASPDSSAPLSMDPIDPIIITQRLTDLGHAASSHWQSGGWDLAEATAALEAAWIGLRGISLHLRTAGFFGTERIASVASINVSGGGAPKHAVEAVAVDYSGIVGDTQASRQHHGRPWQALSLWSTEVIETLAADGHPIATGSAGENLTLSGIDWSGIRPGMVLQIGEVLCEISSYTMPCTKIAKWFTDGDFRRIDYRRGPFSRVYATVLMPGRIATGDRVIVEPALAVS
jgi:MOSC domain-containing protein YiiM